MRCLALLAVAAPVVVAAPAQGAARTATLPGWANMTAAVSGRALVVTTAAPVRVVPGAGSERAPEGARRFTYYRAEAALLRLDPRRRLIAPRPLTLVSVRSSIGAMTAGRLSPTGDGRVVMVPGARAFAAPVVLCCDAEGVETVIYSESRPDAPVPLAAALDGAVVRVALRRPDGALTLAETDPAGPPLARTEAPLAGASRPGLVALAAGVVAWAPPDGSPALTVATPTATGAAGARTVALPGSPLEVVADRDVVAALVRVGGGFAVARVSPAGGEAQVVWAGGRRPRLAVGGGAVAVAAGRRVLAARAGRLRPVRRAGGTVAAVAVDRDRVVLLARVRRGGERRTVVRIEAIR